MHTLALIDLDGSGGRCGHRATRTSDQASRAVISTPRPADDLGDFLGDLRLAGPVVLPGQGLDHVVGVLGRRLIATRRAICSLTAASRKHLNSRTLNDTGRISSRMSWASGRNSYYRLGFGRRVFGGVGPAVAVAPTADVGGHSGSSVSTTGDLPGRR